MPHVRVQCELCHQKAWKPDTTGPSEMVHASCPKRGTGATRKLPPKYVPVSES